MKLLSPTQHKRLNEVTGFLMLSAGLVVLLSLVSYHAQDPSLEYRERGPPSQPRRLPWRLHPRPVPQGFGAAAFLFPLLAFLLSWKWIRSDDVAAGGVKVGGFLLLTLALRAGFSFRAAAPVRRHHSHRRHVRLALARYLVGGLNLAGACWSLSPVCDHALYLVSTFTLAKLAQWLAGPLAWYQRRLDAWQRLARERARAPFPRQRKSAQRYEKEQGPASKRQEKEGTKTRRTSGSPGADAAGSARSVALGDPGIRGHR